MPRGEKTKLIPFKLHCPIDDSINLFYFLGSGQMRSNHEQNKNKRHCESRLTGQILIGDVRQELEKTKRKAQTNHTENDTDEF